MGFGSSVSPCCGRCLCPGCGHDPNCYNHPFLSQAPEERGVFTPVTRELPCGHRQVTQGDRIMDSDCDCAPPVGVSGAFRDALRERPPGSAGHINTVIWNENGGGPINVIQRECCCCGTDRCHCEEGPL